MDVSAPTFTRRPDGSVTVDGWTPRIRVSMELLVEAQPEFLRTDGDTITLTVANGAATYRIAERGSDEVLADLVEASGPRKAA